MLSFLISNAIIVSQALTGMTPCTTEYDQNSTYVNIDNVQSLTVTAKMIESNAKTRSVVSINNKTKNKGVNKY